MDGPIVLFLGPTLPAEAARRRLDAEILPPCRMGDVYRAVSRRAPRAIGIVDGYFEATPAVWHKEILYALSIGIPVFGASSMGALRAAELHPYGMEGVGRIFDDYASGRIVDDDEVAVAHGDAAGGFQLASDPMVNLRHGLALARGAAILDAGAEQRITAALKSMHYSRRSWQAIWDGAGGLALGRTASLRAFVEGTDCDLKAKDARSLIDRISTWDSAGRPPPATPSFDFEPTIFWEELVRLNGGDGGGTGECRLLDHVRVAHPDRDAVLDAVLLHHLVEDCAARLGVAIPDDRANLARFRRDRDLASRAALETWMAREDADRDTCLELARHDARRRALLRRVMPTIAPHVAAVLRSRGEHGETRSEIERATAILARDGVVDPDIDQVPELDPVLTKYQRRAGPIRTDLDDHAAELGFGSTRQFLKALLSVHLASDIEEADHGSPQRHHA